MAEGQNLYPQPISHMKVGDPLLVEEAAKRLEMNPQTLRLALQQRLFPFGVAVRTSENRYTYKIFETRLEKYLDGSNEKDCFGITSADNSGNP